MLFRSVCISSPAENQFLIQLVQKANDGGGPRTWIGLTDNTTEGDWKWINGEPLSFTCWFSGEPNNCGGGENRVVLEKRDQEIKWNDVSSDCRNYYIIEYNGTIRSVKK